MTPSQKCGAGPGIWPWTRPCRYMMTVSTQGKAGWEITTVPAAMPSRNKHISTIAAIMGGGEEVTVDETAEE